MNPSMSWQRLLSTKIADEWVSRQLVKAGGIVWVKDWMGRMREIVREKWENWEIGILVMSLTQAVPMWCKRDLIEQWVRWVSRRCKAKRGSGSWWRYQFSYNDDEKLEVRGRVSLSQVLRVIAAWSEREMSMENGSRQVRRRITCIAPSSVRYRWKAAGTNRGCSFLACV